jgi:hypothetical protein
MLSLITCLYELLNLAPDTLNEDEQDKIMCVIFIPILILGVGLFFFIFGVIFDVKDIMSYTVLYLVLAFMCHGLCQGISAM